MERAGSQSKMLIDTRLHYVVIGGELAFDLNSSILHKHFMGQMHLISQCYLEFNAT